MIKAHEEKIEPSRSKQTETSNISVFKKRNNKTVSHRKRAIGNKMKKE